MSEQVLSENQKPIKLAIIAPHPVQYHAPLYKAIYADKRFDSTVFYLDTLGIKEAYDPEFNAKVSWDIPLLDGYKHEFIKNYAYNNYGGFFSRINPGLISKLRRGNYDAVFLSGYSILSYWLVLFVSRFLGIKVIWRGEVTERIHSNSSSFKSRVKDFIVKSFFKRCDSIMYTCQGNLEFIKNRAVEEKIKFPFSCSVDNAHFDSEYRKYSESQNSIKAELNIPLENLVLLFCGRLIDRKRIMDVVEGIHKAGNKDITLVVVGDGPRRSDVEKLCAEYGIDLKIIGFVNQSSIGKYYTISDVLVLISEYDPSPKALNESLNFKIVPIVSKTIGTADDLVIKGKTGFQINLGDIDALGSCITQLRDNRLMQQAMAQAAYDHVKHFSFEDNVVNLYNAAKMCLDQDSAKV